MLSCKQATRLISQSCDRDLVFSERLGLGFHLLICRLCRRYSRQIAVLQQAVHRLFQDTDRVSDTPAQLSKEARERIELAIRHHQNPSGQGT